MFSKTRSRIKWKRDSRRRRNSGKMKKKKKKRNMFKRTLNRNDTETEKLLALYCCCLLLLFFFHFAILVRLFCCMFWFCNKQIFFRTIQINVNFPPNFGAQQCLVVFVIIFSLDDRWFCDLFIPLFSYIVD